MLFTFRGSRSLNGCGILKPGLGNMQAGKPHFICIYGLQSPHITLIFLSREITPPGFLL